MNIKYIKYFGLAILLLFAVKVFADTYSVTAYNSSGQTIGDVYINLSDGTHPILSVGGNGEYGTTVGAVVNSVTINGQTVPFGGSGTVTLTNSTQVSVSVTSDSNGNMVIIISGGA